MATSSSSVASLVAWLADNSAEKQKAAWAGVKLGLDPRPDGDRALVAGTAMRKGTRLPVPPACILTEQKVRESVIGRVFGGLDVYTLFSMFLVAESLKEESFWKPYIAMLPKDIGPHPINLLRKLTDGQKQKLSATHNTLFRALVSQEKKLQDEWGRVAKVMQVHRMMIERARVAEEKGDNTTMTTEQQEIFDQEEKLIGLLDGCKMDYDKQFLWANCMVISRAFSVDAETTKQVCMIPLADSMNHTLDKATVLWRPKLPRGFFMVSVQSSVEAGQELCANYHGAVEPDPKQKDLDELRQFVMYGFSDNGTYTSLFEKLTDCGMTELD